MSVERPQMFRDQTVVSRPHIGIKKNNDLSARSTHTSISCRGRSAFCFLNDPNRKTAQ
ncbi:MAG: hypothetical protein MZU79_05505 [Anaerotruncus sp.]|nr:hypothetical protein [Anaerotruncus sp.]